MTSSSQSADVLVIGGGVIGLSVAWRAAQRGMSVTVLERDTIGGGTSRVAAGMLAPVAEAEFGEAGRRLLDLGLRSADMWPAFAQELEAASGQQVGLLRTGTLMLARDADEARELERQIAFRDSLGLVTNRLRASQAREREPALAPTVRLALEAPEDHSVDPRRVLVALRAACQSAGVRLREHAPVARIESDAAGERLAGVTLGDAHAQGGDRGADGAGGGNHASAGDNGARAGVYGARVGQDRARTSDDRALAAEHRASASADRVPAAEHRAPGGEGRMLASGGRAPGGEARMPASGGRAPGGEELIAGERVVIASGAWSAQIDGAGERVAVRPVRGQLLRLRDPAGPGLLSRVVRFAGGYLVPRADGRYVLGATVEERGFDLQPDAGGVYELLRAAQEVVPGVRELKIEELCVGLRPGTPDNAPAIGAGALRGLTWATGHHRNGILLAPLTAQLVCRALAGEQQGDDPAMAACDPRRFAAGEATATGAVVS